MGIRELTKLLARISFVLGVMAFLTCFFDAFLFYGMICSIAGTIMSIIVLSIRTHFQVPTTWKHPSIIGIVLCSTPVIYLLFIIFFHKA